MIAAVMLLSAFSAGCSAEKPVPSASQTVSETSPEVSEVTETSEISQAETSLSEIPGTELTEKVSEEETETVSEPILGWDIHFCDVISDDVSADTILTRGVYRLSTPDILGVSGELMGYIAIKDQNSGTFFF